MSLTFLSAQVTLEEVYDRIEAAEVDLIQQYEIDQSYVPPANPLIDVWANFETFSLEPYDFKNEKMVKLYFGRTPYRPYKKQAPKNGNKNEKKNGKTEKVVEEEEEFESSIPTKQEFTKRFSIFTNDQFNGKILKNR